MRILADNEIRVIQPYTPFLKEGGPSTFVDVVISGAGSIWGDRNGEFERIATVQVGDVIGDISVLLKVPRTATIRSDTYYVRAADTGAALLGDFAVSGDCRREERAG